MDLIFLPLPCSSTLSHRACTWNRDPHIHVGICLPSLQSRNSIFWNTWFVFSVNDPQVPFLRIDISMMRALTIPLRQPKHPTAKLTIQMACCAVSEYTLPWSFRPKRLRGGGFVSRRMWPKVKLAYARCVFVVMYTDRCQRIPGSILFWFRVKFDWVSNRNHKRPADHRNCNSWLCISIRRAPSPPGRGASRLWTDVKYIWCDDVG